MPSTKNNIPLLLLIPTTLFLIVAYTSAFIGAAAGRLLAKRIRQPRLQRFFTSIRSTSRRELKFIAARMVRIVFPRTKQKATKEAP